MSANQVSGLLAVADDLQRANLSIDGVNVAGGSDTTQKAALAAQAAKRTLAGAVKGKVHSGALTLAGYLHGNEVSAFFRHRRAAIVSNMNAAGIEQASDLMKGAMLNPRLAPVLLSCVTEANHQNVLNTFGSQNGRIAAARAAHVALGN